MSEWRDIWKDSIRANQIMIQNEEEGFREFDDLAKRYGNDGMIHYSMAEAYESLGKKELALNEFEKAKELFPVEHWKAVADGSIDRLKNNKNAEQYFDLDNFEETLWYAFQKIYEYCGLSSFIRYVSLSAISRASSEWPLSLVDFRTALEILIKNYFPEMVERIKSENYRNEFNLSKTVYELKKENYISSKIYGYMRTIITNGNNGTHDPEFVEESLPKIPEDIIRFIKVLEWFNSRIS